MATDPKSGSQRSMFLFLRNLIWGFKHESWLSLGRWPREIIAVRIPVKLGLKEIPTSRLHLAFDMGTSVLPRCVGSLVLLILCCWHVVVSPFFVAKSQKPWFFISEMTHLAEALSLCFARGRRLEGHAPV